MGTLILQDGTVLKGISFGAIGGYEGEIVFNTSVSGYQEIITDPCYAKQILVMTYPEIGNCGINDTDFESENVALAGLVVKNVCKTESHYKSRDSLASFLKSRNIVALEGIDTRTLVKKIRDLGTMNAYISSNELDSATIKDKLLSIQNFKITENVIKEVSTKGRYVYNPQGKYNVAIIDYGLQRSIISALTKRDCRITVYPCDVLAREIIDNDYNAVFLSGGPGNPELFTSQITQIKNIMGKMRIFGISLGAQLLALSIGAKIFKLKYGHRGSNHPVVNLENQKVIMTSQNHGYAIDSESLPKIMRPTYKNLNDDTLEGFEINSLGVYAVQFHPEPASTSSGTTVFDEWINIIKKDIDRINEVRNER